MTSSFVAVLQLDTRFPRLLGDIGNALSFKTPVRYYVISDAVPSQIVHPEPHDWLPQFIDAARQAQRDGASLITTSCGFLAAYQNALAQAVSIPVIASSLCQFKALEQRFGAGKVGVLTMSSAALNAKVRAAATLNADTPVVGMLEAHPGVFSTSILENRTSLDETQARSEVVSAALALQQTSPALKAMLLECTNLGPYRLAITQATGLPTFDLLSLIHQEQNYE